MTDQQMMLLEQLTYYNNNHYQTVREMVNALMPPESDNSDMKKFLEALKNDEQLMNLRIRDTDSSVHAMLFTDTNEPDRAIVAFQGTFDGDEWVDNGEGLGTTDTKCQRQALNYIESLPEEYKNISVIGHSKGGNKAMYVALLSDRVDCCVSMDGQWFSEEFYEKYSAEISENVRKIRSYALNNDFVNILLRDIPGVQTTFIANNGRYSGGDNHQPYALLTYDEDGNLLPLEKVEQSSGFKYLHELTEWISVNMTSAEKEMVGDFLGPLLAVLRDPDWAKKHDINIVEYLQTNSVAMGIIIGYLTEYVSQNHINVNELESMLFAFLGDGYIDFQDYLDDNLQIGEKGSKSLATLIKMIAEALMQLANAGFDILENNNLLKVGSELFGKDVLEALRDLIKEHFGVDLDLLAIVQTAKRTRQNIHNGTNRIEPDKCTIRDYDYSEEIYTEIMDTMNRINEIVYSVTANGWNGYASNPWFRKLMISTAVKGINKFSDYIQDNNAESKKSIDIIFNNAKTIDYSYSKKIDNIKSAIPIIDI